MIKAIIFDLDNTLFDFWRMKETSVKAAVAAMVDAGLDMSIEEADTEIHRIYKEEGIEYQVVFDHFLQKRYGEINHKILAAGVVAYRKTREAALTLYPHVTNTLTTLAKRGLKLAILTDAPPKQAWLRLCYLNLHHLFDAVVTSEEAGATKPSPLPFNLALRTLDLNAGETLMVGDWPERDMVGAKSVGIKTVYAKYGNRWGTDHPEADFVINDISELLEITENMR